MEKERIIRMIIRMREKKFLFLREIMVTLLNLKFSSSTIFFSLNVYITVLSGRTIEANLELKDLLIH